MSITEGAFAAIPQWLIDLVALALVVGINLVSVKWFGELEFWAALIKVVALVMFLIIGTVFLAGRFTIKGETTGPRVIVDNGGLFPSGVLPLVLVTTGVVFAYAAVELVGTAAGETENPEKIMPRATNSVIARIALFYVDRWCCSVCSCPKPPSNPVRVPSSPSSPGSAWTAPGRS